MATTSSILAAGKALGGRQGNGGNGRFSIRARILAGAAILGCAATLAIGGLRGDGARQAPSGATATNASANTSLSFEQWRFLEDNVELPGAGAELFVAPDQFTYREDRRISPPITPAPRLSWPTIWLIEQNQLPGSTPSATFSGAGPEEYLLGEEQGSGGGTTRPDFGPQP